MHNAIHKWKLAHNCNGITRIKAYMHGSGYLAGIPVGIVDTGIVTLIQPLQHCACVSACVSVCVCVCVCVRGGKREKWHF